MECLELLTRGLGEADDGVLASGILNHAWPSLEGRDGGQVHNGPSVTPVVGRLGLHGGGK